jgi:mRNA-degrading endonuclease toxin of MazEF toxin-antitoxin module
MSVRRGEVWWVNFDPMEGSEIRKTRPAVVVTADALNRARRTVVVVRFLPAHARTLRSSSPRPLQGKARSRFVTRSGPSINAD